MGKFNMLIIYYLQNKLDIIKVVRFTIHDLLSKLNPGASSGTQSL